MRALLILCLIAAVGGCAGHERPVATEMLEMIKGGSHHEVLIYRDPDVRVQYRNIVLMPTAITPQPEGNLYLDNSRLKKFTQKIDASVTESLGKIFSISKKPKSGGEYFIVEPYLVATRNYMVDGVDDSKLFVAAVQDGSSGGNRLSMQMDVYDGKTKVLVARYMRGLTFDGITRDKKSFKKDASRSVTDIVDEMRALAPAPR